jgi:hypothetical protein
MPTNEQILWDDPSEQLARYHRLITSAFPDIWNTGVVGDVIALDHTAWRIVNGLTS